MRAQLKQIKAWLFLLLFVVYTSSNALFIHVHIVDGEIYVHAHPYHKGEAEDHIHTSEQLLLLDHYSETSFNAEQLSSTNLIFYRSSIAVKQPDICIETMQSHGFENHPLRAPPAFV